MFCVVTESLERMSYCGLTQGHHLLCEKYCVEHFFSELTVNALSVKIVPISSYVVMNITDLY